MVRIKRLAALIMLVATTSILVGCDPGFSYWVRNDTDLDVVVRFEGSFYRVPAGTAGQAESSLGVFEGSIEVADDTCKTMSIIEATTQMGLVVIDDAGTRLVDMSGADASAIEALPAREFEATQDCIGRVQPAASSTADPSTADPSTTDPVRTILFIGGQDRDLQEIGSDGAGLSVILATPDWEQNLTTAEDATDVLVDVLTNAGVSVARVDGGTLQAVDPTGWGAAISPDGKSVAFMRGELLYEHGALVVQDELGVETPIAPDAAAVAWSPDGQWLSYEVMAETEYAQHDLWVVRADGSDPRRLTEAGQHGSGVVWAPDSRRIAFSVEQDAGQASLSQAPPIYVFDIEAPEGTGGKKLGTTPKAGWSAEDWSPDGSSLLVDVVIGDPIMGGWRVAAVDVASGEVRALTEPPDSMSDRAGRWSPDGGSVLFLRSDDGIGEYLQLWVMDATGEDQHLVVTGVTEAVWGPDSQH